MNILFLDFDGVLNSRWSINENRENGIDDVKCLIPHKKHINVLNQIIEKYDFLVVVISTWRIGNSVALLDDFLYMCGAKCKIISKTPDIKDSNRGDEIKKWIAEHNLLLPIRCKENNILVQEWEKEKIEKILILDDDNDMGDLDNFLVLIDNLTGLCDEDILMVDNVMREQ